MHGLLAVAQPPKPRAFLRTRFLLLAAPAYDPHTFWHALRERHAIDLYRSASANTHSLCCNQGFAYSGGEGKRTYGGRPGQRVEEQGTWASRTQKHREAGHRRPVDRGAWTAKTVKRPRQQPAHPQHANYWAPLTRKRHTMPHSAQAQHTNHWAPRTRKRHQQEHRPQWPTESSDPTQHAKGRTGDCPGPRKGATTRRNVTQGGGIQNRSCPGTGNLTSLAACALLRMVSNMSASSADWGVGGWRLWRVAVGVRAAAAAYPSDRDGVLWSVSADNYHQQPKQALTLCCACVPRGIWGIRLRHNRCIAPVQGRIPRAE